MKNIYFYFYTLSLLLLLALIKGDLPIHCLKSQITGTWKFDVSAPTEFLNPIGNTCGHHVPDHETTSYKANENLFQAYSSIQIKLSQEGNVEILDQKNLESLKKAKKHFRFKSLTNNNQCKTYWTMIYNEGFEIYYDWFSAFMFSFYFNDQGYKSNCSDTLQGWYHIEGTKLYGCIHGIKVEGNEKQSINEAQDRLLVVQDKVENQSRNKKNFKKNTQKVLNEKQKKVANKQQTNKVIANQKSDLKKGLRFKSEKTSFGNKKKVRFDFSMQELLVERLNKVKKLWVAGTNEYFKGKTIEEIYKLFGRVKKGENKFSISRHEERKREKAKQSKREENLDEFPKSFSWEKYLVDPPSQGNCGSCYAIASTSTVAMRLAINFNITTKISIQHVLDCSYYNQGCDGGYPSLVGRFGKEVHLVEETCKPYKAFDGKCQDMCDFSQLDHIFKIKDYGYVKGIYEKATEKDIMEELHKNGPVIASFEPDYSFSVYKSGIMHQVNSKTWLEKGEEQPEWQKIDHSVVLYGWGEEDGNKFWLLQNSWGSSWGENGTFKMKRGTDEFGIESSVEYLTPYVIDLKTNTEEKEKFSFYKKA